MPASANPMPPSGTGYPRASSSVNVLFAEAYRDLRSLARNRLRSSGRATLLNTTALVHESYLRLVNAGVVQVNDKAHFMSYAARAMRSVVVDLIRKRGSERHGGHAPCVTLDTNLPGGNPLPGNEILAIHEALDGLGRLDPRMAQIVEMRYFAGMTEGEIAVAMELSDRTVRREWEKARLWLSAALGK